MTKVIHWKSDMTHSDVHGRIDKKKKHWEICIEISQCLISIIEMFFSNLPMFFRALQKDKRTKRTYMTVFIHLSIRIMRYIADLYYVKWFCRRVTLRMLKSCFAPTWIVLSVMKCLVNSWTKLRILSGLFSERTVLGKKSDILFAFAFAFNNTIIRQ